MMTNEPDLGGMVCLESLLLSDGLVVRCILQGAL